MAIFNSEQLTQALSVVPEWRQEGAAITRTFAGRDFVAALKFVNEVARLAEEAWHHPDIDIRWNKVTLVLSTHSEGGLTEKDFALARLIDAVAPVP